MQIVVVDDDPPQLRLLARMLASIGAHVATATTGAEALALVCQPGGCDVLVTDWHMAPMSGRELAAEVRRGAPHIRIIVCSGNPSRPSEDVDVWLTKPTTTEKLLGAIGHSGIVREMDYALFAHDNASTGVSLESLEGYDDDFLLGEGRPLLSSYPKRRPVFPWKNEGRASGPRKPKKSAPEMVDVFASLEGVLVVSERCCAIVCAHEKDVEPLPVALKGEKAAYFILNVLGPIPCPGVAKSGLESDKPELVLEKLAARSLPADRALVQIAESSVYVVRSDLRAALETAGIRGAEFTALRA